MRKGAWHQCGDKSQKLVAEQLEHGVGVGVVLSPRDLAYENWGEYSQQYRSLGASVLFDPQFYVPDAMLGRLPTYPSAQHRASISSLLKLSDQAIGEIAKAIEEENRTLETDAVIAPAITYEASRLDIVETNQRLFEAAKAAGSALGKPTYATVTLATSLTSTEVLEEALSDATALDADGWYFAFEFEAETGKRLPTDSAAVFRCLSSLLLLACTGKPVLHACAGPMALLSFGAGATGAAIGHNQNVWTFNRGRFEKSEGQGGGGAAPARFFSSALWGTLVQPDETISLSNPLRQQVMTHSPFSEAVRLNAASTWSRWDAGKHLVFKVGETAQPLADAPDAREAMNAAIQALTKANQIFGEIKKGELTELKDATDSYQKPWVAAASKMLAERDEDYAFLASTK